MDANSLQRIVDDPASTAAERAAAQRQLDTLTGQAPSSPVTGHTPVSPDRMIMSDDVRFWLEVGDVLGDRDAMHQVCARWKRPLDWLDAQLEFARTHSLTAMITAKQWMEIWKGTS